MVRLQPATGSELETFGFGGSIAPDGNTLVVVGQMRQAAGGRGVVARIQLTSSTTDPCAPADSPADAICRLRRLGEFVVGMTPQGRLHNRLVRAATMATSRVLESADLTGRRRRKKLAKALRLVARFQTLVQSVRARRTFPADVVATLTADTAEVERILRALRAAS